MKRDYLKKHAAPDVRDQIDEWDDNLVDSVFRQCLDLSDNADLKGSHKDDDGFPYITDIEFHPNGSKTVHISGARVMIMPDESN